MAKRTARVRKHFGRNKKKYATGAGALAALGAGVYYRKGIGRNVDKALSSVKRAGRSVKAAGRRAFTNPNKNAY